MPVDLAQMFPRAGEALETPDDPQRQTLTQALQYYAGIAGKRFESSDVQEFLAPHQDFVNDLLLVVRERPLKPNTEFIVRPVLEGNREAWWKGFHLDYTDIFKQWYWAGAFAGGYNPGSFSALWPGLLERTRRRDWLIRLGAGW